MAKEFGELLEWLTFCSLYLLEPLVVSCFHGSYYGLNDQCFYKYELWVFYQVTQELFKYSSLVTDGPD